MPVIHFTIPGRIGGKGRARFSMRGGLVRAYTPEKTRNQEAMLRMLAAEAMRGQSLLEGALSVHIEIIQQPPLSWSKKKRAAATWITGKPDADNTIKLLDALNGIVWRDDSQIAKLHFERRYDLQESERVEIEIYELQGALAQSEAA